MNKNRSRNYGWRITWRGIRVHRASSSNLRLRHQPLVDSEQRQLRRHLVSQHLPLHLVQRPHRVYSEEVGDYLVLQHRLLLLAVSLARPHLLRRLLDNLHQLHLCSERHQLEDCLDQLLLLHHREAFLVQPQLLPLVD